MLCRGAGDTRFVTWLTFGLAWPLMVGPAYVVVKSGGSVLLAWGFASLYIVIIAGCFWLRFRTGRWKAMRVIEPTVVDADPDADAAPEPEAAEAGQVPAAR